MPNVKNLIDQNFGKLTIISRAENDKWGRSRWLCRCECGGEKIVNSRELKRGNTASCGCNYLISNKAINLIGQRFGRLKVIRRSNNIRNRVAWECVCDCGHIKTLLGDGLRRGLIKSCGCLQKELATQRATTHGHCYEKLYGVWNSMRQRCTNPKSRDFPFYGGRGIEVCSEWGDYVEFRQWAFSHGYAEGLTIERVDNDGNYHPENCEWIPLSEQAKNTRRSLINRV